MIINKKIVYARKKEEFEPLIPTIPEGLNPVVFIEDTREMWTCGTYFSIGYPSIEVSEVSGSVKVQIGNSFFLLTPTGDSISLRKGDGNRIIISSNALNRVDTEPPLKWDASNRKLLHMESGVASGSYGQSTNLGNASVFVVPNFIVDATGHITFAENHNIEIRDYVEQVAPSNQMAERNILLSYNEANNNMDTSQVRKANGLTFNDATQRITVAGGMVSDGAVTVNHGDVSVLDGYIIGKLKGDVEGQATPKIHLSLKPEYGGASTKLYGHVKLQDILSRKPDPSSDNENINDTNVVAAIAASPLMVWNAIETAKSYADSILGSNNAMLFKGALEAGISSPGTYTPMADVGNTYVVTFGNGAYRDSVGYINGVSVEVGDLLICKEATAASDGTNWEEVSKKWTYVQTNTTGVVSGPSSSTIGQLAVFDSTTGKLIKGLPNGSVGQMLVISESGIPTWANKPDRLNHALSFQVKGVEFTSFDGYEAKKVNFIAGDNMFITPDNQGNLTLAADPGNDTVNTAGATDLINTKLFLIGAESQTESPQTYSNRYVYVGADNCLYSDGKKVSTTDHTHPIYVTLDTEQTINGSKTFTTPIISTVASGTAPFRVTSDTLVHNLNADRLDNLHENSFLRYRDTVTTQVNTLWAQIGIRQYNKALPDGLEKSNTYNYGSVISLPGNNTRLDIWYNHRSSDAEDKSNGIQYRTGWGDDKMPWRTLLDTVNYASYSDGRYVKKAGDTMTGALHLANGTRNNAGDDCGFGDCNIRGCLGLQGLNGATGLAFIQQGASWSGGNNYRFTWNGSNMTSSSTAQWNNLNADLLDGYHQAAFSMGWTTSTKYRVDRWGGGTDKNWKKIVTYVCTGGGQYQSCKVKGTIYYITGNHNQGHVIDIPFEAIMYAYSGTADSMLNQSYLYLPPYCTWDMIRIVRYNNNSWEVQVRQPSDRTNISLEYTVTNNGGSVSAGQFTNTSYSSTVANNYNTNVSRPNSSYTNHATSADRLTIARSINGTNFDGTANITTSYWGTARNFTIGNTTRSVNGSANVSWSFADIGGAPANHSHNYINSRGNLNPQTGRTQNLGDVYSYNTTSGTSSGAPTTYTSVIGFGRSTGGTVEIAGGRTAGMGLWYRALRDTTDNWYGWVKVWDTKNFDPNSKANSNHNHDGSYITKGGSNNNVVLGAGGYKALSDFTLNSNWAASKDVSGYVKFPNGFIIQWGEAYVGANSTGYKSFPIAFPTACISVQVTHKTTATNWDKVCVAGNYTRTSCTIANGETVNSMINWMALGY